ncbi:hypothetical protein QEN19_001175 [Hanseniaspora menglaensis]
MQDFFSSSIFEQLLLNCQSPNKVTRETAEQQLLSDTHRTPNLIFSNLLSISISSTSTNDLKLFCMLTIRKLITVYWSEAMPSFNGSVLITDETLKEKIKTNLLEIAVSCHEIDHRVTNCARYVIVQIASCDYPDSWPDMIIEIMSKLHNDKPISILNGLFLLTDLFEDVMTDDLFFINNTGSIVFNAIVKYVEAFDDTIILEQTLKLYASCITMLTASQVFIDYEDMVVTQLSVLNEAIFKKFNNSSVTISPDTFKLWKTYFELIQLLRIHVTKSISKESKQLINDQLLLHLQTATSIYISDLNTYYESTEFVDYVIVIIALLSMVVKSLSGKANFLCDCFIKLNKISSTRKEELLELDIIVEDIFDKQLNVSSFSIRDQIETFFYNIKQQNKKAATQYQSMLLEKVIKDLNCSNDIENCLSLLTNCLDLEFANDTFILVTTKLYESFIQLNQLEQIRLNYFASKVLKNDENLTRNILGSLIKNAETEDYNKLAVLIFAYRLDSSFKFSQSDLIGFLNQLIAVLDSDGIYPMLEILEKLSTNINIDDHVKLNQFQTLINIINSNSEGLKSVAVCTLIDDILENIFEGASIDVFIQIGNKYFDQLIKMISGAVYGVDISSLKLSIAIFNSYVSYFPDSVTLPKDILQFLMPPVLNLANKLLELNDDNDDLLEESIVLINSIVKKSDYDSINTFTTALMEMLSTVFSTKTSCNKIGTLTLTVLIKVGNNFSDDILNNIILKIVNMFIVDANENNFRLSEDLINIICYMAINNTTYILNIISSMDQSNIKKFFDKWFSIFESLRGIFLIKCNIVALINIYNSKAFSTLFVKGDVKSNDMWDQDRVITRSMSKKINIEYEEILLAEKILHVFISELLMQINSGDQEDEDAYEEEEDEGDDEDAWEDIDENLNYNQLNDLVKFTANEKDDQDYEEANEDDGNFNNEDDVLEGFQVPNKTSIYILIQFVKANVNTVAFRHIYDVKLNQEQRSALANALI